MEGKTIITNEIRFYPLLVSGAGLEAQTDAESEQVWEKLAQIPVQNKKILLSSSIIENLYAAEQKFQWEPYCSARLAYFIRELFFQNISQPEFYKATEALFTPKYQQRFNEILSYINDTILTSQPDPEEIDEDDISQQSDINLENLKQYALLDALGKFPNLGNQKLTVENIKLKNQAALVRPTLTNWLKSYRDELGIGKHDAVARAQFLFESFNGRKLNDEERECIHTVVRSIEDNELIYIDPQKQAIVFVNEQKGKSNTNKERASQVATETTPDIFERFQSMPNRNELQNVGTQTFAAKTHAPGEREQGAEEAVLGRIKNMIVFPPKANAPAPEEDFDPALQGEGESEPLGTLRFSAKHVLPAERKENMTTENTETASRMERFSPQAIPIPGNQTYTPHSTGPQQVVHAPEASLPRPQGAVPPPNPAPSVVAPPPERSKPAVPAPSDVSTSSVFRIKPNRE